MALPEEDALELRIKLDYALRSLEEKSGLLEALKENVASLAAENGALKENIATLSEVQHDLLNKKHAVEQQADLALREKAELASEAARLHVYAKDCAMRAEAAVKQARELRSEAEARAKLDAAIIKDGDADSATGIDSGDAAANNQVSADAAAAAVLQRRERALKAQLAASRLLVTRLLGITERAGISVRLKDLLQLQGGGSSAVGDSAHHPPLQPMERELLVAALSRLGYTHLAEAASRAGMVMTAGGAAATAATPAAASSSSLYPAPRSNVDSPLPITAVNNNGGKGHAARKNGGATLDDEDSTHPNGPALSASSILSSVTAETKASGGGGGGGGGGSMLSPLTRPFVALGESFWTTLVGDDTSSTPGGPRSSPTGAAGFADADADGSPGDLSGGASSLSASFAGAAAANSPEQQR